MFQKTKIILILILCLSLVISYGTGCFSDGADLAQESSGEAGSDNDESGDDINSRLTELKDQIVSSPVVLSHESGEVIYGSGERELIFIKGYADSGNTIEVYINDVLEQSNIFVDGTGNFEPLNGV